MRDRKQSGGCLGAGTRDKWTKGLSGVAECLHILHCCKFVVKIIKFYA